MSGIAFTGHRTVQHHDKPPIIASLMTLSAAPQNWHSGGAAGFDTIVANFAPPGHSVLHIPFTYQLTALRPAAHHQRCNQGNSCVPIPYNGDNGRFQRRNQHMVDNAERLYAYYLGTRGGTHRCITYALSVGVPVYDIRTLQPITSLG